MESPAIQTALLVGAVLLSLGPRVAPGADSPATTPRCVAPEQREFDFWVGDWDAYDLTDHDKVVARNHVDVILDGCVVREIYEQADGLKGQSFSIYDASRKVWHQTWVTNRGTLLTLEGHLEGARMILEGIDAPSGRGVVLRGTWGLEGTGVRETAETSSDGGRTWKLAFDIMFRTHKG
jgi:hypothetical protein